MYGVIRKFFQNLSHDLHDVKSMICQAHCNTLKFQTESRLRTSLFRPYTNSFKLVGIHTSVGVIFMHSLNLENTGRNFVFSKRLGLFLGIYLLVPQTKDILYKNVRTPDHHGFVYE